MPETTISPPGLIASERPLTELKAKAKPPTGPLKPLPPLKESNVANSRVTLPSIRMHYSQIYTWALNSRTNPHTGEPLPTPDRKGGQFSFFRLRLVNKNTGQRRILLVENSGAAKWPIKEFERLANPPGIQQALDSWESLGRNQPFPKTYEEDATPSAKEETHLEHLYGVIEVVFDHKEEMDLVYEANGVVPPSKAFDPLIQNDFADGRVVRGPREDDMISRYASKGV